MSKTASNIKTAQNYEGPNSNPAAEVSTNFRLSRITLSVFNAAIFRQLLIGTSSDPTTAVWQDELLVMPGREAIRRKFLFGIRTRSVVVAAPAKVNYELIGLNE